MHTTPPEKIAKNATYRAANRRRLARYAKLHRAGYRTTTADMQGLQRRLQALRAIGWTRKQLAARLDVTPQMVEDVCYGRYARIGTDRASAIRALYDELHMQPQTTPGAKRAITYAREKFGWAPPLAWDNIDTDRSPYRNRQGVLHARENH